MGQTAMNLIAEIDSHSEQDLIMMEKDNGCQHYERKRLFIKGEGLYLWDKQRQQYLDCNAVYSAAALGHRNEELISALQILQRDHSLPLTANAYMSPTHPLLVRKLTRLTGLDKALIMNTGAEAVETAVKIARRWAYRKKMISGDAEIISFRNCFHGRTISAIAMSSEEKYRDDFEKFPAGFVRNIPYNDIVALKQAITPNTAAIFIEPIQCEGGMIIPSKPYFQQVRELCTKHNILMIADEVQTGLGRTGKLFGCDWYGVKPDMILLGKALGQIVPVSAVVGIAEAMNVLEPGSHGSTFGGNGVSCGIAWVSLDLIAKDDFAVVKNAAAMGLYFQQELNKLKKKSPYIKKVRGIGLAIGIEINTDLVSTNTLINRLLDEGIVSGDAHGIALRVTPPLTITKKVIDDWAIPRFKKALCP